MKIVLEPDEVLQAALDYAKAHKMFGSAEKLVADFEVDDQGQPIPEVKIWVEE